MRQKETNGHTTFRDKIASHLGNVIMDLGLRASISRWYMSYFVDL